MIRKFILPVLLLFISCIHICAQEEFEVDGIKYKVDPNGSSYVNVVSVSSRDYVDIPVTVSYNDNIYFVSFVEARAFADKQIKCINIFYGGNLVMGAECFDGCSVQYLNLGAVNSSSAREILKNCNIKYLSLSSKQKDIANQILSSTNLHVDNIILDGIDTTVVELLPKDVKSIKVPSSKAGQYRKKFSKLGVSVRVFNEIVVTEGVFCGFVSGENLDFTSVSDKIQAFTASNEAIGNIVQNKSLELTPVTGVVKKNTPLFILPSVTGTVTIPVATTNQQDEQENGVNSDPQLMCGHSLKPRYIAAGENLWALSNTDHKLHPINPGGVLAPGVPYLIMPAAANALSFGFSIPDATGINEIKATEIPTIHYSVTGSRISEDAPGLHILSNGKKQIVR